MPYATLLHHIWWRKKKVDFIIPPTYFRNNGYSIVETTKPSIEKEKVEELKPETVVSNNEEKSKLESNSDALANQQPTTTKISALSLASIRHKKELSENQKTLVKEEVHLPNEPFTETQMQEQWLKYAQRLEDKGQKIMSSLLTLNDPKLDGTTIVHELPNESSKIDFEREQPSLLGYLRGKLHNHEIQIRIDINESIEMKKAFTSQDKYNRFVELNPSIELLRKLFDLDI